MLLDCRKVKLASIYQGSRKKYRHREFYRSQSQIEQPAPYQNATTTLIISSEEKTGFAVFIQVLPE
ncbi:MAG: hypothetical protein PWQ96_2431 [Clostridia bacterium]|nr:hypothetical protein [Clostridia bacterium]